MRELIYIHGAGSTPEDAPWSRLVTLLGAGWKVTAPRLGEPDAGRWIAGIDRALEGASPDVVLLAHSLGVSVLIQTIALKRPGFLAAGLVGLSAPFWERKDMAEYTLPDTFPDALSGIRCIVLFHAPEDEVAPFDHLAKWGKRLPRAELRELKGADHEVARGEIGPVAEVIKAL